VRDLFEPIALERDDPLVALGMNALVDRHGQDALAQQLLGPCLALGHRHVDRFLIVTRIGAQSVRRIEIDDQKIDRSVGACLQDEPALELERGADQRGKGHSLAEQPGDRFGIAVTADDGVECGTEPDDAATAVEILEGKGDRHVVAAFGAVETILLERGFRH
jgi:hypothetical protein